MEPDGSRHRHRAATLAVEVLLVMRPDLRPYIDDMRPWIGDFWETLLSRSHEAEAAG